MTIFPNVPPSTSMKTKTPTKPNLFQRLSQPKDKPQRAMPQKLLKLRNATAQRLSAKRITVNVLKLGELVQPNVLALIVVTMRQPEKQCLKEIQVQVVNAREATVRKITVNATVQGKNVQKSADASNATIQKELLLLNLLRGNIQKTTLS